jgi:fructuronate reductase
MRLSDDSLKEHAPWEAAGFALPRFDRAEVKAKTAAEPRWLHFGAGNIFRGFPAALHQTLLDAGEARRGIIVAEAFDPEILDRAYRPYDNLAILVILKAAGTMEKRVIASVTESLAADPASADWKRLEAVFTAPCLQMVSFTVTEKGYVVSGGPGGGGTLLPDVAAECAAGPGVPRTLMGKAAALCYVRFRSGAAPLALVSMDNCSHNGSRLREAVLRISREWEGRGFVPPAFLSWLEDPQKVSFPWTMIDKITPRPDGKVKAALEKAGLEDTEIFVTGKNTWIAPFVNAEETGYLVIEDRFPNGRPPLEKAGVIFTDGETVEKVEKMKVCTCLNPLHTALAIYGCLLGYTAIHEEMKDPCLVKLITRLGYVEGMPVVSDPGIISPAEFLRQVLEVRLPNPFMPDTPQRIACDTSQKLPVRFGETLKALIARGEPPVRSLTAIPLVFAGWCRYLLGLDDQGRPFELSPDPLLGKVRGAVAGFTLGGGPPPGGTLAALRPLLGDPSIFGVDLYAAGLAEKTAAYFNDLLSGPGAVRRTLEKYST